MITVQSLSKRFGSHCVLDDISLSIQSGETVCLLGPSGSGKTTLLRCLNGLERADQGTIEVDGTHIEATASRRDFDKAMHTVRMRCGFIFQHFNLFPHLTALENIALAPVRVKKVERSVAEKRAMELLQDMGISARAEFRPGKLSGGEQQRVAIARALAMEPNYLLYDEPTSALDKARAAEVWSIIRRLASTGQTQLIVTHQEELAQAVGARVIRIENGKLA